jgi:hypothetical protein
MDARMMMGIVLDLGLRPRAASPASALKQLFKHGWGVEVGNDAVIRESVAATAPRKTVAVREWAL